MAKYFFTGGHAGSSRRAVCLASQFGDEGEALSHIFFLNIDNPTKWEVSNWNNGAVASCDFDYGPGNQLSLCVLSDQGLVSISNRHGILAEKIPTAGFSTLEGQGYMSSLLAVGQDLFACGDSAQLYRRQGPDDWQSIVPELAAQAQVESDEMFRSIASGDIGISAGTEALRSRLDFATMAVNSEGGILVGGGFGLVARVRGSKYEMRRLDDRSQIVSILEQEGHITAVGWRDSMTRVFSGTFESGFSQIVESRAPGNATCATRFDKEIYVGSKTGLFVLHGTQFEQVRPSLIKGVSQLDVFEDVLWVIGHHDVYRLSQDSWERFPQPD